MSVDYDAALTEFGHANTSIASERRRYYYRCQAKCTSRFVPVRRVEDDVEPLVLARLVELRAEVARSDATAARAVTVDDYVTRATDLDRKQRRVLDMYEDGAITREAMRSRLAKLDGERLAIEADRVEAERVPALADASTRRALIADLKTVQTAWRRGTRPIKRSLVTLLVSSVRLEAGKAPAIAWFSASELAEDFAPVNVSAARTCSTSPDVHSRFRQVFSAIGVTQ